LILVVAAPVLGALAVRWRISDLSAGKLPAAGRVAWVAEGELWVKDLPDGKARQLAAGENISRPAWSPTAGTYFSYGWTVRTAPVCGWCVVPGMPHHVTQRGNRRQQTFFCEDDTEHTRT